MKKFRTVFCVFLFGVLASSFQVAEAQELPETDLRKESNKEYANAHYQITLFAQHGRTLKRLLVGFGFNNAVGHDAGLDSKYKFAGSRFFEIGGEFSTALNTTGFYRLNYGLSFQFNGLKPKNNQYFEEQDRETRLTEFPFSLQKSKFRMDNLVIPVHFEFGPADLDYQARSWRIGLGAYSGIRLGTRQKLKYKEEGHKKHRKSAQRLHTNDFIYGLSAYIGYGKTALYVKYDLNPIFKHNPEDEHNLSLGMRITLY